MYIPSASKYTPLDGWGKYETCRTKTFDGKTYMEQFEELISAVKGDIAES